MQLFFFKLVIPLTYYTVMKFMKINIKIFLISKIIFFSFQSYTQVPYVNNSCYCIEESNAQPNILYFYRVNQQDWVRNGTITYTGASINAERMEAMAINAVDGIIYAFDGAKFGTIEIGTNKFTLISSSLSGKGKIQGNVINNFSFGDIDGLTYNPYTRELWATNRIDGNVSNDILFKINPETGAVIKGVFGGYDFVEIEESFDSTLGGSVYDVDDIAINPFTNQMFAIQNQDGPGIITLINKTDGSIENEVFDLNEDDVEGLGFSGYGFLYGSTGDDSDVPSSIIEIDFINFETEGLDAIDESLPGGIGDFESFDCVSDYVDLALTAKTNGGAFNIGDIVDMNVTIYNQGTIEIDKLEITMRLPSGLTLISSGWLTGGGQIRKKLINSSGLPLLPGSNYSFTVKVRLDNPTSNSYSLPFEISKVQNNIISFGQGYMIDLPDVDSNPDSVDNESNVKNNEINGNGKFFNEDEDDHDVANFSIISNCPQNLTLPNINQPMYNAGNAINTNANINSADVKLYAGQEINFNIGFEIGIGEELIADIQSCP